MKRLQEETMTKMAVLGKGSMRDKQKVLKLEYYYFNLSLSVRSFLKLVYIDSMVTFCNTSF